MIKNIKDIISPPIDQSMADTRMKNFQNFTNQMKVQVDDLKRQFIRLNKTENPNSHQFQQQNLQDETLKISIGRNLNDLQYFLDKFKIMEVFFLGQVSSGKTTYVNSLLAQQVMPSRNQQCTQDLLVIEHNGDIPLDKAQVYKKTQTGLKQEFCIFEGTVDEVCKYLNKSFDEINETLYIRINSLFHQQLPIDFQNRVVFVDTPGLNLSDADLEQTQVLQQKIQSLIEGYSFDYHVVPITIWLTNYQTVDHDQVSQYKILNTIKNQFHLPNSKISEHDKLDSQESYDNLQNYDCDCDDENHDHNNQQQIKQQSSLYLNQNSQPKILDHLIILLNKYDERKESEDAPLNDVIQQLLNTFEGFDTDRHLFKTSGLMALNYRIMNYGHPLAKERLIAKFYRDNGRRFGLKTIEEAKEYCQKQISDNTSLIECQDYEKFQDHLLMKMKNIIQDGFYKMNSVYYSVQAEIIALRRFYANKTLLLTQEQVEFCQDQNSQNRKDNHRNQVNQICEYYKVQFQVDFQQLLSDIKPQNDVKKVETIRTFIQKYAQIIDIMNQKFTHERDTIKSDFFEQLVKKFPESQEKFDDEFLLVDNDDSFSTCCKQIFDSMTNAQMCDLQRLSFLKHTTDTESKIGHQLTRAGSRNQRLLWRLFLGQFIGLTCLSGPVFSGIQSLSMLENFISMNPIFVRICLVVGVAKDVYGIINDTMIVNPEQIEEDLKIWGEMFESQIDELAVTHINILNNSFDGVKAFLKRLIA